MAREAKARGNTEVIEYINLLIRQGKSNKARAELKRLSADKLPREALLKVAELSRRVYSPSAGLKLLNPYVRPTGRAPGSASEAEKAEYAACLTKIGAPEEALKILESLDADANPEIILFRVFALFARWEYSPTISLLQMYLAQPKLGDYQRVVGKVNLVSALLHERRHFEAGNWLKEIVAEATEKKLTLLHGNALHLLAVNAIFQQNWDEAHEHLKQAKSALSENDSLQAFFVRKWEVIASLLKHHGAKPWIARLKDIQAEAKARKHWETIRDCERFRSIATDDETLCLRLFFGTPYPEFRKWLLLGFGRLVAIPAKYDWEIRAGRASVFDLQGPITGKKGVKPLVPGEVSHRLLMALSSDFYRPQRLAELHHRLYPDEFYNWSTSPTRVHQALKRLREWCESADVPFVVVESAGFYRLSAKSACTFRLSQNVEPVTDKRTVALQSLKKEFPTQLFSLEEARKKLGISYRSAHRIVEQGLEDGKVTRVGQGALTRYTFFRKVS